MDRGIFIGASLLGMAAALAVFYPLGAKRRACIPYPLWWVCLGLGIVVCIYGLAHSTAPSFAPRITAVGKAYDHVELRQGRNTHYGFHFLPDENGEPMDIETSIILPGWAVPEVFNGRTFRVVYLQSSKRALKNEAIDIEILAGRDTGFHDSVDARPVGVWLAIPIGAALGTFGYFGLRYKKDEKTSAAPGDDDTP
jgi:hypothetical protein